MKTGVLILFLSILVLGILLNSAMILADGDSGSSKSSSNDSKSTATSATTSSRTGTSSGTNAETKPTTRSNGERRVTAGEIQQRRERTEEKEFKKEIRTADGRRFEIEKKVEKSVNGEIKVEIKRKITENNQSKEVIIVIERDENGVSKIKVKGFNNSEVKTELEVDDNFSNNEPELKAVTSDRKETRIKVLPDRASEIARERLKANNFTVELKEINGSDNIPKVVYIMEGNKTGKFLGIFKRVVKVHTEVNPETGEVTSVSKPWWVIFVTGVNSDQTVPVANITTNNQTTTVNSTTTNTTNSSA